MKFTNETNLPPAVFDALTKDNYDPGESDYSCTTLLKSPRMVQLGRRHVGEIVKACVKQLWSLLGRAVHLIFEDNTEDDAIAEVRMYIDSNGKKIGGMLDHYKDGVITDYKCTSVWSWIFGGRIKGWTEQANIYAEIYRANGFDVKELQIIAVFRDWKLSEFIKNPSKYPPEELMVIKLEVWEAGLAKPFIDQRTAMHVAEETTPDDGLPLCSSEEIWAKPDKYAVMKNKLIRASRVLDTEEDALAWIEQAHAKDKKAAEYRIDFRPGSRPRCEHYCDVAPFCNQYQEFLKSQETTNGS
jgi:hypothetical protein